MKNIFLTNNCFATAAVNMFRRNNFTVVGNPESADYLVFLGGADVSPELYGEKNTNSWTDPRLDDYETQLYKAYPDKKKLGICRGGQLLNVLSGGKLWQDTDGHGGDHKMRDLRSGDLVMTTSVHHQMMRPSKEAEILAIADRSTFVQGGGVYIEKKHQPYDDIEVCWYRNTRSLCFQGHPELAHAEYFFHLVRQTVDAIEA